MLKIQNTKGMAALCTAAAVTPQYTVAFLSIAGAQVAVKAIWASVVSRRSVLRIGNGARTVTGDPGLEYLVLKQHLAHGLHHWVLYPDPASDAPYLLLVPLNGMTAQEQLVHLLNRHTLWPVKDAWGALLWERGRTGGGEVTLIQELRTHGCLPWAYAVNPGGWDEVIDAAAREGVLSFESGGGPCPA